MIVETSWLFKYLNVWVLRFDENNEVIDSVSTPYWIENGEKEKLDKHLNGSSASTSLFAAKTVDIRIVSAEFLNEKYKELR